MSSKVNKKRDKYLKNCDKNSLINCNQIQLFKRKNDTQISDIIRKIYDSVENKQQQPSELNKLPIGYVGIESYDGCSFLI